MGPANNRAFFLSLSLSLVLPQALAIWDLIFDSRGIRGGSDTWDAPNTVFYMCPLSSSARLRDATICRAFERVYSPA